MYFASAITVVRPGSCIFFYSDADPKDSELEAQVIREAKAKNIHIAFLIRGSCNTGIPFYDRLEAATKTTCLKQHLGWYCLNILIVVFGEWMFFKIIDKSLTVRAEHIIIGRRSLDILIYYSYQLKIVVY